MLTEAHQQLAVKHLERMRRARNRFQYEARPLSGTDANTAADTAVTLVEAVRAQAS